MKIYINEPPSFAGTPNARIDALTEWLSEVAAKLNLGLQNIGEENLSEELSRKLDK